MRRTIILAIAIALAASLAIVGCDSFARDKDKDGAADHVINPVTGEEREIPVIESNTDLAVAVFKEAVEAAQAAESGATAGSPIKGIAAVIGSIVASVTRRKRPHKLRKPRRARPSLQTDRQLPPSLPPWTLSAKMRLSRRRSQKLSPTPPQKPISRSKPFPITSPLARKGKAPMPARKPTPHMNGCNYGRANRYVIATLILIAGAVICLVTETASAREKTMAARLERTEIRTQKNREALARIDEKLSAIQDSISRVEKSQHEMTQWMRSAKSP